MVYLRENYASAGINLLVLHGHLDGQECVVINERNNYLVSDELINLGIVIPHYWRSSVLIIKAS